MTEGSRQLPGCTRAFLLGVCLGALQLSLAAASLQAAESPGGTCVIVGGGLRHDNAAVFQRMIEVAGGKEHCRFAIFPTASNSLSGSKRFAESLTYYGVPADQIVVIDIRSENADKSASDPAIVEQIRRCNAAYFMGGDQELITQSLRKPDGVDTPALAALWELWRRGGVVAGSSAGAAVQSEIMIAAAGLPDNTIDDGMDTFDFGITKDPRRRGLLLTRGLGFFRAGIIDQHFSQLRGRLGRLARAAIDAKVRFGFGIDENTAIVVSPKGGIEVVGPGCLTIVDATAAKCADGPLGCRIDGLHVSCLQTGDRYHPKTGELIPNPAKELIAPGTEWIRGNHLVTDITAEGAVPFALFSGLAANTGRAQIGIALRYTQGFGHGYRWTFCKSERTRSWSGHVNDVVSRAVQDVDLTIEPIVASLQPAAAAEPVDLPEGAAGIACRALWFRGILLADDRRRISPDAPLTRSDMATALAHAAHLVPPEGPLRAASSDAEAAPSGDDIAEALEAKLMELDERGHFRPEEPVSRQDAALALVRLMELTRGESLPAEAIALDDAADVSAARRNAVFAAIHAGFLPAEQDQFHPTKPLLRRDAANAIYRLVGFPW